MPRLSGTLLLASGPVAGSLEFGETITAIDVTANVTASGGSDSAQGRGAGRGATAGGAPYLVPGFIDVHVHGGGGGDTMDGADGVVALAAAHLAHGTTSIVPTTITNPWDAVLKALDGVSEVRSAQAAGGKLGDLAEVLGAHLEGPLISPAKLGAQPPYTLLPTPELVREVVERQVVRLVTLAPEVEGAQTAAVAFAKAGVRVSLGHTVAGYQQVDSLIRAVTEVGGVVGFTHLYNAMSALGSREPGVVGAALAGRETYAELILDLHHVHPASFLAALAAKPDRLLLITDGIRATATGDTDTELGGERVTVRDGAARLADGTLAGSVLTLDSALRNAVAAGVPLHEAARLTSAVPAAYLGLRDRGHLEVGLRADILVLDEDLRVVEVFSAGRALG